MARMSADKATRAYVERRVAEGRSKLEVIRVLKRYVARELYRYLPRALKPPRRRAWPHNRLAPRGCLQNDLPARRRVPKPAHAAELLSPRKSLPSPVARPCPAWPSCLRQPERTLQLEPYGYGTGPDFHHGASRDGLGHLLEPPRPPSHRAHMRPGESVIVAGGLSETVANRVAEAINEFLGHIFGRPTPDQFSREIRH